MISSLAVAEADTCLMALAVAEADTWLVAWVVAIVLALDIAVPIDNP